MKKVSNIQLSVLPEDNNLSIQDLNIDEIIPVNINGVVVTLEDDHQTLYLPPYADGMAFKSWYNNRGGIITKDILNKRFNRPTGKYVIIKGRELHCIARIINEDEESAFKTRNLIDGKLKDKSYMILKHLNEEINAKSKQIYINESDIIENEQLIISGIPSITSEDINDELDYKGTSISLFNE